MSVRSNKLVALFLLISLLVINCSTLKTLKKKGRLPKENIDKTIRIEGKSDLGTEKVLEKLSKKARIPNYR